MKNIFIAIAMVLFASSVFAKEVKTPSSSKASALAQIAEENLAGQEATSTIESILNGQGYDLRVSIMSTTCVEHFKTALIECDVIIGQDDLNDDDNGWGTVYKLNYKLDSKNKVTKATFELIAG